MSLSISLKKRIDFLLGLLALNDWYDFYECSSPNGRRLTIFFQVSLRMPKSTLLSYFDSTRNTFGFPSRSQ